MTSPTNSDFEYISFVFEALTNMSQKDLMLQIIHQAIGLAGKESIPLNVCSIRSLDCDGFDIDTVVPQVTCVAIAESKRAVRTAQGFVYLVIDAGQPSLPSV